VDVTITNNHVDMMEDPPGSGIRGSAGVIVQATQAAPTNLCANIQTNSSHWRPITVGPGGGIKAEQAGSAMFRLERGSQALDTPVATVLELNNSDGPYGPSTATVLGTPMVVENGACQLPSTP
jgi:hypothetical protein